MRRADFDIAAEARLGSHVDLEPAERVINANQHLLQTPGVIGVWAGALASAPYVMVAVNGKGVLHLSRAIPDSIEGVDIYYIEGALG